WGLSLVTVAVAGLPALFADWHGEPSARRPAPPRVAATAAAAGLLVLAAVWAGGSLRLAAAGPVAGQASVPDVRLRLVQAAIDPAVKGNVDARAAILELQLRLTRESPGFDSISHVIWPETAVLFLLEREPQVRAALADATPAGGLLITGVPRAEPPSGPIERIWNSLAAVDPSGAIVAGYDKSHLVPFGEYVPFHDWLPFLSKITPGTMDYSAGPGPRTLRLPGLPPAGPLICYEVIFPGKVVERADRPAWLFNLTNDGWYGISAGPYQHFASARLRAIEEGLPLVRAANTGISGVIDAHGRVTAQLGLGQRGVLDADLPLPLGGLTPYARWGDWTALVLGALVMLGAVGLRRFA
ncbi:MAG: apolipoprotein N-acyltransferase, partial [Dongiaceae bacterium]